jgi:predicted HicB family RNase H-like nuclease
MSTKLQKDKKYTKQVRIDTNLHQQLKLKAALKDTVMSSLLNSIVKDYLNSDKMQDDSKKLQK